MVSTEEAVRRLRDDPGAADLVQDAYLGLDVEEGAERFFRSGEFAEVRRLLAGRIEDAVVLDVGAGNGIASYAFAKSGARLVYALEPDPSDEIGRGAIARACAGLAVELVEATGEGIPLGDASVDIVYARQVLHHSDDLRQFLGECARVLRPGGVLLACREHVVDDDEQLAAFLAAHPVHSMTGGEHAYPLHEYEDALRSAGFRIDVLDPWDSVINAFPAVRSQAELRRYPQDRLRRRVGPLAPLLAAVPPVRRAFWRRVRQPTPGRMYSFVAHR